MKKVLIGLTLLLSTIGVAVAANEQPVAASTMPASTINKALAAQNIIVKMPLIQLVQNGATSAKAFMELNNKGNKVATLIAANSMTANQVLLQKIIKRNGKQTMKKVNKIVIKPHSDINLQPGGFHVMLMGIKQTLHKGDAVPILLIFNDGSSLTVKATVG